MKSITYPEGKVEAQLGELYITCSPITSITYNYTRKYVGHLDENIDRKSKNSIPLKKVIPSKAQSIYLSVV